MGSFDYVNFEMDCPKCGEKVRGFQSKSSVCELIIVDPVAVDNMYSDCQSCGYWIELVRHELPEPEKPRDSPYNIDEVEALGFRTLCDV